MAMNGVRTYFKCQTKSFTPKARQKKKLPPTLSIGGSYRMYTHNINAAEQFIRWQFGLAVPADNSDLITLIG